MGGCSQDGEAWRRTRFEEKIRTSDRAMLGSRNHSRGDVCRQVMRRPGLLRTGTRLAGPLDADELTQLNVRGLQAHFIPMPPSLARDSVSLIKGAKETRAGQGRADHPLPCSRLCAAVIASRDNMAWSRASSLLSVGLEAS